jgi:dipeptidyl aminopeptidase/acylaminoacyl peptidase
MTFRRDNHPDQLISASLSGDLTGEERTQLDAHLAGCEQCRQTLAAFSEQRNLLGAMRRTAPPRDLGPRVRAGIEAARLPWWRRPGTWVAGIASLATVAAALLAVVVLGNITRGPVGSTGSPTASLEPSVTALASATVAPSDATPAPSESPLTTPAPSIDPAPVAHFAYTLTDQGASLLLVDAAGKAINTVDLPDLGSIGAPLEAVTSPDGSLVAFRLQLEGKGTEVLYALQPQSGEVVRLGETQSTPFVHRLSWSPDGRYLAFTLVDLAGRADAWTFDAETKSVERLTDVGQVYVADFEPGYETSDGGAGLWVSVADSMPATYRVAVPAQDGPLRELSPSSPGVNGGASDGIFLPAISPDNSGVIYWKGQMQRDAGGLWTFARGGMMYLGTGGSSDNLNFGGEQLFPTLSMVTSGQGFASADVRWAPDSDGYAVWNANWTGTPQPAGFPSPNRVYFGHVSNGEGITTRQALDEADLPADGSVVDVALAPDAAHLAITVRYPVPGELAQPRADLFLITRNVGDVPDEVAILGVTDRWTGPAIYPPLLTP